MTSLQDYNTLNSSKPKIAGGDRMSSNVFENETEIMKPEVCE